MKTIRTMCMSAVMLLIAVPLFGQAPGERLERLRLDHMQRALELTEEQVAAVAEATEQFRRSMRESREREHHALEELRDALRAEPVDQDAVRGQLQAIERERAAIETARRQHLDRMEQQLDAEQRAKLLLFNRQFEGHLRELVDRHRGGHGQRGGPRPGMGPGFRGPGGQRMGPGARGTGTSQEEIARLRQQIAEMERRIAEMESQD